MQIFATYYSDLLNIIYVSGTKSMIRLSMPGTKTMIRVSMPGTKTMIRVCRETKDIASLRQFAKEELIYDDKDTVFLQVPVPSQITPQNAHQFILHILLKYGRFETEVDLTTHPSVRDSFRYAKLIGNNTDEQSLIAYSNNLLHKYIVEEVFEYSFSMKTKGKIMVQAHTLFRNVIVYNKIPVMDMPQTSLQAISEKEKIELEDFWNLSKKEIIQTAFFELGMMVVYEFVLNCYKLYNI